MLNLEDLPRDDAGMIQGAWRIVHDDPAFTGTIGAFDMRDGESVEPAYGRRLAFVAAECGASVYLEPWGDLTGFWVPEWIQPTVPDEWAARLQRCPRREAAESVAEVEPAADEPHVEVESDHASDDLDAMNLDDLRALASLHNVTVDGRWRESRIRDALRSAGITG
jgi:hypothetical protein